MDKLNYIYPEINYIMTIRDPRDIIVSMIKVGKKQEKLNMQNQFPRNIELLCKKINDFYWLYLEKNQKKFLKEKIYLIKYEDFITKQFEMLRIDSADGSYQSGTKDFGRPWEH